MNCCKNAFIICEPIPNCLQTLSIKTPIISDEVTIKFIDKFDKGYLVVKTSNVNGLIDINLKDISIPIPIENELPENLLNEYAGDFKLIAYNSEGVIIPWIINGDEITALIIKVRNESPAIDSYMLDPYFADGDLKQFYL